MSFFLLGAELDQLQVAPGAVKPCYSYAPAVCLASTCECG